MRVIMCKNKKATKKLKIDKGRIDAKKIAILNKETALKNIPSGHLR